MTRSEANTDVRRVPPKFLALLWCNPAVLRAPVLARLRASVEASGKQSEFGAEERAL